MERKRSLQPGRRGMIVWTMSLAILVYGVFVYFPIGYGLFVSFYNWNPFRAIFTFVGLDNYRYILSKPDFLQACGTTLVFTAGSLAVTVASSLFLAALLQNIRKGVSFYRGVYFMPVISASVATGMLFRFIFNFDNGMVNSALMALGGSKIPWLLNPTLALGVLVFAASWKDVGYALVLLMAGINNIDASIYESASIDGCSKPQQFFSITLPLIRNTLTILVITKLIDFMQVYTPVKFITEGGPGTFTQTISFYIFEQAFTYYNFGAASATSFLLFAVIFVISIAQLRLSRKGEEIQ